MRQIERYIFRRVFVFAMATLVISTVIAMTTQILLYLDVMTATGQSIVTFLTLATMLVPKVGVIIMPFALLIAASQTLGSMNEDSELVVMEAAGAPPQAIARPVLVIGVIMALATLFVSHVVEPWSNRQVRDIITSARGDLLSAAIRSGSFTKLDDDVHVNVASIGGGGDLNGIFISDSRDSATDYAYYAQKGAIIETATSEILAMSNGQVQRRDKVSGDVSIVEFQTYALDLALFPGAAAGATYFPKERSTPYLFHPDAEDAFFTARPDAFVEEINRRFSEWLYPILIALIVLTFLGRAHSNRSERTQYALLAFLCAIAYRGVGFYVTPESGDSRLFTYLTYAVPAVGIVIHAALVFSGRSAGLPALWIDALGTAVDRLAVATGFGNALSRPRGENGNAAP